MMRQILAMTDENCGTSKYYVHGKNCLWRYRWGPSSTNALVSARLHKRGGNAPRKSWVMATEWTKSMCSGTSAWLSLSWSLKKNAGREKAGFYPSDAEISFIHLNLRSISPLPLRTTARAAPAPNPALPQAGSKVQAQWRCDLRHFERKKKDACETCSILVIPPLLSIPWSSNPIMHDPCFFVIWLSHIQMFLRKKWN